MIGQADHQSVFRFRVLQLKKFEARVVDDLHSGDDDATWSFGVGGMMSPSFACSSDATRSPTRSIFALTSVSA